MKAQATAKAARRAAWRRALTLPVAAVLACEAAAHWRLFDSETLAAPSAVLMAWGLAVADGSLVRWTAQTLAAAAAGFGIGASFGLVLGLLLGTLPALDRLLRVSIEALRPVPPVALIPLAMLVFGLGLRMEFTLVAFSCTWPVMIFTRAAVAGVEPRLIEVARAISMTPWQRSRKIVLPAALPRIFVGLRLAVAVALVVAVTVEVAANPQGLGHGIMAAQESLRADLMLALLAWIGVIGWCLNRALLSLQGRLFVVPTGPGLR